jgi:hypothetical protein
MSAPETSLYRDDTGAVMLFALFVALFLVGALYYMLGVGDALLYRRVMQVGADAGAFSASIVAAKGMNLHALLNVAMAATAGILLVVRSVEVLLEIVIGILHAMSASLVLAPKAIPLAAALTPAEAVVERVGDTVEQFVRVSHDTLEVAHHAVQRGYPLLAGARAIDIMSSERSLEPPVVTGFVIPVLGASLPSGGRGLPVEKNAIGIPCERAASALGNRLRNVRGGVPRWLLRFLGGVVEKALTLGKRRTCNDDIVESPRGVLDRREDQSEVWLGHEEFQYRAFDIGSDPHAASWQTGERGVLTARGGNRVDRTHAHRAHALGRVGLAQSEFYFDGTEDKSEWLWKQRWRARLRRFRIPRDLVPSGILGACSGARVGGMTGTSQLCDVIRDFAVNAISAH